MLNLKHFRFTVKQNKLKRTIKNKRKMFGFPVKKFFFTKKQKNKNKMFQSIHFFGSNNRIDQLKQQKIKPSNASNASNLNEQKQRFKQYLNDKNIERKNMFLKKINKTNNAHKTPIYNRYVSGSGIGASNITIRRLKKKYS
jgi:hypothetical protein